MEFKKNCIRFDGYRYKSKIRYHYLLLFLFFFLFLSGCKKEDDGIIVRPITIAPTKTILPTSIPTITPIPTPDLHVGRKQSFLTGEWILIEDAMKRPYAVMFNNISVSSPQSGIGDADILYEALVEAGITRLMGIYGIIHPDSKTAERLGSIRSARHYFVSFASEYDAIFIHYGETSYAIKKMKALKTDNINGTSGYGVNSFYRDNSIKAPHNAFASLDGILKGITRGNYRVELSEDHEGQFSFYEEDTILDTKVKADKVMLPFSGDMQPYLIYKEETKKYSRFQFKKEHIDYNTKEVLEFKNIIIQFVNEWNIDKNGYQTMDLEDANGMGYYITNGTAALINWEKKESTYFMKYYDMNGNELKINIGKTYIAIFPNHRIDKLIENNEWMAALPINP